MTKTRKNEKGFGAVEALLVLVIVAIVVVAGIMTYENHTKTTVAPVATTATPVKSVPIPSTTPKQIQGGISTPVSATSVVQIPELGIQLTVPSTMKDIVYTAPTNYTLSTGQTGSAVDLSTTGLTNLDSQCSARSATPPLGRLSKTSGQYPASPDVDEDTSSGALVKQYASYYIAYSSPQTSCSNSTIIVTIAQTDLNTFKASLSSITSSN